MSTSKSAPAFLDDARPPLSGAMRRLAASSLTAASALLARLAASLLEPATETAGSMPHLEFHVDVGATGGRLYLDGELIGHLPGVERL